jgi:SAM-dependent methyltransferase
MEDITIYNSQMAKAIEDKLWFEKFLSQPQFKKDVIIYDLGCADGELIRHLAPKYPNIDFVGIDNSVEMIQLARARQSYSNESYVYSDNGSLKIDIYGKDYYGVNFNDKLKAAKTQEDIIEEYKYKVPENKTVILIMSSVFHEIVYYEYDSSLFNFYKENAGFYVFQEGIKPDYIFFRDMIPNESINRKARSVDISKIKHIANQEQLESYLIFHDIEKQRDLVQFLLKYKYTQNWKRECNENYFPCTFQDLPKFFEDFNIIYSKQYILPYTHDQILKDFDIDVKDNTHVNIIFKRKEKI